MCLCVLPFPFIAQQTHDFYDVHVWTTEKNERFVAVIIQHEMSSLIVGLVFFSGTPVSRKAFR